MIAQPWWTWIALVSGWSLAAVGAVVLLWALFWDRSRGRRRCPKCWYELTGVPGRKCPECAHEARSESQLLRTRRRKWRALMGVGVVIGAYAMARSPDVVRFGWHEFVPTTLAAGVASTEGAPGLGGGMAVRRRGQANSIREWWRFRRADLAGVMQRRLSDGEPWGWQARWYIGRVLRAKPPDLTTLVIVPPRWPREEPIPAFAGGLTRWDLGVTLNGCVRDSSGRWPETGVAKLDGVKEDAATVEVYAGLAYNGVHVWEQAVMRPMVIKGRGAECLERDDSAATTRDVQAALRPRLHLTDAGVLRLMVRDRTEEPDWWKVECGVFARLVVRVDGEEVGRGRAAVTWGWPVDREWMMAHMTWAPGAHQRLSEPEVRIAITVTGETEPAWSRYREHPFNKARAACWTGEFEVAGTLEELRGERVRPIE